jgi:hypothetical protein
MLWPRGFTGVKYMASSDWAAWFGAVGSVLAVVTSIYVARNSHREQLALQKEMYRRDMIKPMQYAFSLVAQVQIYSRWVEHYLVYGYEQELQVRGYLFDQSEAFISEMRDVDVRDFTNASLVYAFKGLLDNTIKVDALMRDYRSTESAGYDPLDGSDIPTMHSEREKKRAEIRAKIKPLTKSIKRVASEFWAFAEEHGMPSDSPLAMVVKFENDPPAGEPVRPYLTDSSKTPY